MIITQTKEAISITSPLLSIIFSKQNGLLLKIRSEQTQLYRCKLLATQPAFWRAPTDNDIGANLQKDIERLENCSVRNDD